MFLPERGGAKLRRSVTGFPGWAVVLTFVLLTSARAHAEPQASAWTAEVLSLRGSDGAAVTASLALSGNVERASTVVLVPSSGAQINIVKGKVNSFSPWVSAVAPLAERGVGVAYLDVASDGIGRSPDNRRNSLARDLRAAIDYLHAHFPKAIVALGSYGNAGLPLLSFMRSERRPEQAVVVSADFRRARDEDWSGLSGRVTLVGVPSAKCTAIPFLEQQWVASHQHLRLVQANYAQPEKTVSCGRGHQASLTGLEEPFAALVSDVLAARPVPDHIGDAQAQTAWREQVINYAVADDGTHIEMSLLLPDGEGPFPVMVFNHGDIELDSSYIRSRERFRDMTIATEFLGKGIAVAFPARPGIGMSEGIYRLPAASADGDPLYVARRHAADIIPAFEALRSVPHIDASRIIVAGQSAGGYSTMYIASLNLPGVIGAINFSGGRTDMGGFGPSALNPTMIRGFQQAGTTTHVPMLWVFAEQDSRYKVSTIQACYEAFTAAGGQASLVIVPYNGHDGHFIYHYPDTWRAQLGTYLQQIGLSAQAGS